MDGFKRDLGNNCTSHALQGIAIELREVKLSAIYPSNAWRVQLLYIG